MAISNGYSFVREIRVEGQREPLRFLDGAMFLTHGDLPFSVDQNGHVIWPINKTAQQPNA